MDFENQKSAIFEGVASNHFARYEKNPNGLFLALWYEVTCLAKISGFQDHS